MSSESNSPATISDILSRPAEEFGNDPQIESVWAMKTVEHMTVYFNLITSVPTGSLKLTPKDDWIYKAFREEFPDFHVQAILLDSLKSDTAKEKWRPFLNQFDGEVKDFNFATMLRINANEDYNEGNSIVVPLESAALLSSYYCRTFGSLHWPGEGATRGKRGLQRTIERKVHQRSEANYELMQSKTNVNMINLVQLIKLNLLKFFHKIALNLSLPEIEQPLFLRNFRLEDGTKQKGDFSLILNSNDFKKWYTNINLVVENLMKFKLPNISFLDLKIAHFPNMIVVLKYPSLDY